jgi:hypothetical protein
MRVFVCVAMLVILLLVGFLATPGLFKVVNPEYLLALREYSGPLTKSAEELSNIDSRIADYRLKISKLEKDIKDLATGGAAKAATLANTSAPASEISAVGIAYGFKANVLANELSQSTAEMKALEERRASIEEARAEMRKKIDATATDSVNIYVVARALALGAIGALMSIFAKFLTTPSSDSLFEDNTSISRMWASMAMGGIVAVVVIGLFFTGFISIFSNATQNAGATDFWKVTILCLIAGAFSDRLFQCLQWSGRIPSEG